MSDQELYNSQEFIEKYLLGELSKIEREAFEAYLETDEVLSRKVALKAAIQNGITAAGKEKTAREVDTILKRVEAYDLDAQIDDYLKGKMGYSWQAYFEEVMEKDEELRKKVLFRQAMFAGIRQQNKIELEKEVAGLFVLAEQEEEKEPAGDAGVKGDAINPKRVGLVRRILTPRQLTIAATLLILVSLALVYLIKSPKLQVRQQSSLALAKVDQNFDPLGQLNKEVLNSRGLLPEKNESEKNQTFESLVKLMTEKSYKSAITGFRNYKEMYGGDDLVNLYLGILYFKIEDYESAILYFNICIKEIGSSKPFKLLVGNHIPTIARWYLALSFLHLNQPYPAKILLERINKTDPALAPGIERFRTNAKLMLEELK